MGGEGCRIGHISGDAAADDDDDLWWWYAQIEHGRKQNVAGAL
jgi:hypothetical protein